MDNSTIELNLKRWDPSKVLRDRRAIFTGRPGTGKSAAALHLMYHMRDIDAGIVMSPTDKYSDHWGSHLPPIVVYDQYDSAAVKKMIENQDALFKETYHAARMEGKKKGIYVRKNEISIPPVFIICDDCMAANAMQKDPLITEIFMNGRHLKIFLLITAQWMMDMPINKRQMVDYLFVCNTDSPPELERLYKNFFSSYIRSYAAFCDIVEQITQDFGILVLDRTNLKSRKLEDHVFWWKAQLHEPGSFRIGSKELWEHSRIEYCEEWNPQQTRDISDYYKRPARSGPRIKVHRLPPS